MKHNESEKGSHETPPANPRHQKTDGEKKAAETKSETRRTIFYTALTQLPATTVVATTTGGISPVATK